MLLLQFKPLILLVVLSSLTFGQSQFVTPRSGSICTPLHNKIEVNTSEKLDSMVLFFEYLSDNGIMRKKNITTLYKAPYTSLFATNDFPEFYGSGASIVAELYRMDDTLEIIREDHIYLNKTIQQPPIFLPQSQQIPLISRDSATKGSLIIKTKHKSIELSLSLTISSKLTMKQLVQELSYIIVVDPVLSEMPYPTNTTSILTVTPHSTSYLISHTIEKKDEVLFKKMQSEITIKSTTHIRGNEIIVTFDIPSYLLGASMPEQWLFSFAVQQKGIITTALFHGDLAQLSAPRLMPIVSLK